MPDVSLSPKLTTIEEVMIAPLPPSFPLTLVTFYKDRMENKDAVPHLIELKWEEYPPVSSGLAKTILTLNPLLTLNPAISATVWAMALGLISTICV
jgi:hypothetical protein